MYRVLLLNLSVLNDAARHPTAASFVLRGKMSFVPCHIPLVLGHLSQTSISDNKSDYLFPYSSTNSSTGATHQVPSTITVVQVKLQRWGKEKERGVGG